MEWLSHPAAVRFVERLGLAYEAEGLPRSAGRLFAYLLIAEEPRSFEDLVRDLRMSRGGVSANTRFLEERGALERVTRPGDRRAFYRIAGDAFGNLIQSRMERRRTIRSIVTEARRDLPAQAVQGRERLAELDRFYGMLLQRMESMVEDWRRSAGNGTGSGDPTEV